MLECVCECVCVSIGEGIHSMIKGTGHTFHNVSEEDEEEPLGLDYVW